MNSSTKRVIPCTSYVRPPPADAEDAARIPLSNRMQHDTGPQYLAMNRSTFWPNRKVLRVLLLDTWVVRKYRQADRIGTGAITAKLRADVARYARLWEDHCSIRFQFVDQRPADIRVGFGAEDGHWSYVGRACAERPVDERTMNLQFNDDTDEDEVRGTTLHEFGHALGCIHEHQSPASPILWDEDYVIKALAKPPNEWTEVEVRHNVLNTNTANAAQYTNTPFDPLSIMLYFFDASWTTNNIGTHANQDLSRFDKYLISEIYPRDTTDSRRFQTPRIADTADRRLTYPTTVGLSSVDRHSPPPKIAVGLTSLSVAVDSNVRIRTKADTPERTNVIIHLDSWANTKLQSAGCTWFEPPRGSYFQTGTFNTMECRAWNQPAVSAEKAITFATAFTAAPTIIVWLNWIDTNRNHDTSVKAYTTHVTATGFTIHIDSAHDCVLYSGGATWIAFPAGSPGVKSGVITTTRAISDTRYEKSDCITFPEDAFDEPPKALIAVTALHFSHGSELDFGVLVNNVDIAKMDWRIQTSRESMCRALDATWIAY